MYRFAMLLALLVVVAAAGCGGSGDDSDSPPPAVAQTSDSTPSDDTGDSTSSEEAKKKKEKAETDEKPSEDEDKTEDADEPLTVAEQKEELAKLPLKEKAVLVETVVQAAVARFGLKLVDLELRAGGRKATAVLSRKGACNFVASQEPNLELTVKEHAPTLKAVRFEVAGTGKELGYYVLGCKQPEMPDGAGRVVLDHSGVNGPYKSKVFTIENKHWALEWVNEAASLAVLVEAVGGELEGGYFKPVGSQKKESGRYEYTGRGSFQITAYGSGGWQLRVKEIG